MTSLNPGLQKGYALDFGSPVRYVAETLRDGPHTLEDLAEGYSHDPDELSRVWDRELRKPRERRRVKGAQEEREALARQWLTQRALEALGNQVRREGEHYALTVDFDDLRVGGLPLPGSATFAEASAREASRPRASTTARRPRGAKAEPSGASTARPAKGGHSDEASPSDGAHTDVATASDDSQFEGESEVEKWLRANRYSAARLAKALEMEREELDRLVDGSLQPSRVVRLALWALEHGAKPPL